MSDQEKPEEVQEQSDSQEKPPVGGATQHEQGGSLGGAFLVGGVLLVIAAVCYWDGFHRPPEDWERWKVVFNQVVAVVGGLAGLAVIVRALLRPRSAPPVEEEQEETSENSGEGPQE